MLDLNAAFEEADRTIKATIGDALARTNYGARSGPILYEADADDVVVDYDFFIDQSGFEKFEQNIKLKTLLKKRIRHETDQYVDNITIDLRKLRTKHGAGYQREARRLSAQVPRFVDAKVAALIKSTGPAFTENSFDGVPYFSKLHPRFEAGDVQVNLDDGGGGQYWYLFDTSVLPPIFWHWLLRPSIDPFGPDTEYARLNRRVKWDFHIDAGWGMGPWYYGYASNQALNEGTLNTAMEAMQQVKLDAKTDGEDQLMGIMPTLLVVGRTNHLAARKLLTQTNLANGEDNAMRGILNFLHLPMLP